MLKDTNLVLVVVVVVVVAAAAAAETTCPQYEHFLCFSLMVLATESLELATRCAVDGQHTDTAAYCVRNGVYRSTATRVAHLCLSLRVKHLTAHKICM